MEVFIKRKQYIRKYSKFKAISCGVTACNSMNPLYVAMKKKSKLIKSYTMKKADVKKLKL